MPTETVYGLAGDALNSEAVIKIFQVKNRPTFDPLIVHVAPLSSGSSWLTYLQQDLNLVDLTPLDPYLERIERILTDCWPGPLTIVLPRTPRIPDLVSSGLPTVAIRVPRHPVAQALIQAAKTPLAAPSANRFGRISPTTATAVFAELNGRIPYILDGGSAQIGLESTVIAPQTDGSVQLLRPGGITLQHLQALTPDPIHINPTPAVQGSSPGLLKSHYAPDKLFLLLPKSLADLTATELKGIMDRWLPPVERLGILAFSGEQEAKVQQTRQLLGMDPDCIHIEVLSPDGDLVEAARTFFTKLRQLDQGSATVLLAEPCPTDQGLGYAIQDRLRKATAASMDPLR